MTSIEDEYEIAYRAVSMLTSICDGAFTRDGQGFNKPDSHFGHALSVLPPDAWTQAHLDWARAVLPTYKRQLASMGIDLSGLSPQTKDYIDQNDLASLTVDDEGNIIIVAPTSHPLTAALHQMAYDREPVVQYTTPGVHWVIPAGSPVRKRLQQALNTSSIRPSASVQDAIQALPDSLPAYRLELAGEWHFRVFFPKNSSIMGRIKEIPGRWYDSSNPSWRIPFIGSSTRLLKQQIHTYDVSMTDTVAEKLEEVSTWKDHRIDLVGTSFWVFFPKDDPAYGMVKNLPKRTFERDPIPHWVVPNIPENTHPLTQLIKIHVFEVTEKAKRALALTHDVSTHAPIPEAAYKPPKRIEYNEPDELRVYFPYDENLSGLCRKNMGNYKKKPDKHWEFHLSDSLLPFVDDLISSGFVPPDGWQVIVEQVRNQTQEAFDSSYAEDSTEQITMNGIPLRPFQNAGVAYMLRKLHEQGSVLNGDDMGVGKTVQALTSLEQVGAQPALIVVKATLKGTWRNEIKKWVPHRTCHILEGKKADLSGVPNDVDYLIINYDIIAWWKDSLLDYFERRGGLKAIVLDEAHKIQNPQTKMASTILAMKDASQYHIALTGTPIRNRPKELWPLITFLGVEKAFGGNFLMYAKRYCNAFQEVITVRGGGTKTVWNTNGSSWEGELYRKLRSTCMIRRLKTQVLKELPPKQRTSVPVELDNLAEYTLALTNFMAFLENHKDVDNTKDNEANILAQMNALRQLAAKGKTQSIIQWIQDFMDSGEKLVVFAHHISLQDALRDAFPDALTIRGGDTTEHRTYAQDAFQNDESKKLMIASAAGAQEGITLTAASHVLMCELPWTPGDLIQREDRVLRIGQTSQSVNIWFALAENTIDEYMFDVIERKLATISQTLDGKGQKLNVSITKDVLKAMKKGKKNGS